MAIKPIEGFYVHDEESNTDGVAKVSIDAVHEFVEDVSGAVEGWLDEHPEATTTVQDDSLTTVKYRDESVTTNKIADNAVTESKVDKDFLKIIKNPYVTPEMFGAVGDGETDDTDAIQAAIDTGNNVCFQSHIYLIASSINVDDKDGWTFDARNVTFKYTGNDYAFRFRHIVNSNIYFAYIKSNTGGCVCFFGTNNHTGADGTTKRDWTQYVNFHFLEFEAGSSFDCIHVENNGSNWINEIRVYDGRFKSGRNGLYMLHDSSLGISHWCFYNVGVEGVSNGFEFVVGENGTSISGFLFIGTRQAEATSVFKTTGIVKDFIIIDPDAIPTSRFTIDSNVTDWLMILPTYNAVIKDGEFKYYNFDNYLSLDQGIPVAENSDLNSDAYCRPNVYTCNTTAKAQSLSNCPVTTGFTMSVRTTNGFYNSSGHWNYIVRELNPIGSTDIYRQTASSNGSGVLSYGAWYKVVSQNYIEIEQGSFEDSDGTTKITRTDRCRLAEPLQVGKFEKIKSSIAMYVFCLDSNKTKLRVMSWTNELDFSTLAGDVAYVNIAFQNGTVNTVRNGLTGIAFCKLC